MLMNNLADNLRMLLFNISSQDAVWVQSFAKKIILNSWSRSHILGKNYTIGVCTFNIIELFNKKLYLLKINRIYTFCNLGVPLKMSVFDKTYISPLTYVKNVCLW